MAGLSQKGTVMNAQSQSRSLFPRLTRQAFGPLQREMNRLFDELGEGWESFSDTRLTPRMDVVDTEAGLEISVELPGLKEEDVKVTVEGDVLTITGEKKSESERKESDYRILERSYGEFARSFVLPRSIDGSALKASMSHGVLKIVAPKRPGIEKKTVPVQSA